MRWAHWTGDSLRTTSTGYLKSSKTDFTPLGVQAEVLNKAGSSAVKAQHEAYRLCDAAFGTFSTEVQTLLLRELCGVKLTDLHACAMTLGRQWRAQVLGCDQKGASQELVLVFQSKKLDTVRPEAIVPRLEPLGNICKTVGKDLTATTKLINTASCLGLANLVAKKPGVREKGVASLREIFGGPGLLAMLKLKPEAQATALDRFVGLTQAYQVRVQLGDVSQSVIEHLLVQSTELDGADAEMAIAGRPKRVTAADPNVKTLGAQIVHGFEFPWMFSWGDSATDEGCIKHVKEETGANPSLEKLNAYFAEMVTICQKACKEWDGTAETIEVTGKVGVWHVRIKQPDKTKTIFHIDSSYEKSNWIAWKR